MCENCHNLKYKYTAEKKTVTVSKKGKLCCWNMHHRASHLHTDSYIIYTEIVKNKTQQYIAL